MDMNAKPKIKVSIDPMGNPTIAAENFTGSACQAATAPIEKALTSGAVTRELKESFYQAETNTDQVTQNW